MKLKPLNDYLLIEPLKEDEITKGGIVIPETAREERTTKGKVIAVGPGKLNDKGERIKPTIKEGQMVVFKKYSPDEIKIDDKEYYFVKEDDILAVIES
ncbi:MAG: 10 kDa chaperonin [Candidatus Parcubacteria bacterium]|nr:MAG: 10 kDa chaperonin [Candidatus Parcubacteria bacterium]